VRRALSAPRTTVWVPRRNLRLGSARIPTASPKTGSGPPHVIGVPTGFCPVSQATVAAVLPAERARAPRRDEEARPMYRAISMGWDQERPVAHPSGCASADGQWTLTHGGASGRGPCVRGKGGFVRDTSTATTTSTLVSPGASRSSNGFTILGLRTEFRHDCFGRMPLRVSEGKWRGEGLEGGRIEGLEGYEEAARTMTGGARLEGDDVCELRMWHPRR
jgi:hypothetical protein